MFNLSEYRNKPQNLADFLPWAALVADGVVLNKATKWTSASGRSRRNASAPGEEERIIPAPDDQQRAAAAPSDTPAISGMRRRSSDNRRSGPAESRRCRVAQDRPGIELVGLMEEEDDDEVDKKWAEVYRLPPPSFLALARIRG
jgi:hypothetical protein